MAATHYKKKYHKYRIHYGRIFLALLMFATLITGLVSLTAFLFQPPTPPNFSLLLTPNTEILNVTAQIKDSPYYTDNIRAKKMSEDLADIYSPHALLLERTTGKVLFRKADEARAYPASLTKIMTTILALESLPDLTAKITLSTDMFAPLYQMNASMAGFQPEESPSVKDLLYGTMLPSGAECAIGLGREIAGSDQAFVDRMNAKAEELGMSNTHFVNCTGLHDDDHYSTAADMAILLRYALQNETFREIFDTPSYVTTPSSYYPNGISLTSTMFHKVASPNIADVGVLLGGKTGYTGEAGLCLASLADVDGKEYIFITMGANGSNYTEPLHILDAFNVYSHIPVYWES